MNQNRQILCVVLAMLCWQPGFSLTQPTPPSDWVLRMPKVPSVSPVAVTSPLDFSDLNRVEYLGRVRAAKAGVRELLGPMDASGETKFNAAWAPMFDYPARPCLAYLEKVSPLVDTSLSLRSALIENLQQYEILWAQAGYVAAFSEDAGEVLMQQVAHQAAVIRSIQGGLTQVNSDLVGLGDPPDPSMIKQQDAQRYHRAMANLERLLGKSAPLDGGYERTGAVGFGYYGDDPNQPNYSRVPINDTLIEEVFEAWRAEPDGLVLFYNYTETTSDKKEEGLFSFLANEPEEWSPFYAEPSVDGWVTYDFDDEDGMVTATFFRPDEEGMVVDLYILAQGKLSQANHTVYERKPIEQIGKAFPTGESRETIDKVIQEAAEGLQEMRASFLKGRAAFGIYLQGRGFLPDMPNPEDLYWVLKDVRLTQVIDEVQVLSKSDWEEVTVTPTAVKATATGWDVAWEKKTTQYELQFSTGSRDTTAANQIVVASPDEEEIGGRGAPRRVVKNVKTETFKSQVQWGEAPAIVQDGGHWAINPQGSGHWLWAMDGMFNPDRPELMGRSFPHVMDGKGDSYILSETEPDPDRDVDFFSDQGDSHLMSLGCEGDTARRDCYLQFLCNDIHGDQTRFVIPLVVACEAGGMKVEFIYSLQALDEDTAYRIARDQGVTLKTRDLSVKIDQAAVAQDNEAQKAQKAQQERLDLHQANIAYCRQTLGRLEADRQALQTQLKSGTANATDIERFNQLTFMITCQQSNLMAEQDRITELQTGEPTFRRTPFDEMCRAQVIQKAEIEVRQWDAAARAKKKADYLASKLGPGQRDTAYGLIEKCIASGGAIDPAAWTKLNTAMQDIYQGEQEQELARIDEEIAWKQTQLDAVQNVKTGADVAMTLLPMAGGPMAVAIAYQTGCGYVEGGVLEGVKRGITTYSDAADIAVSAYDGWQRGGWWGMVESAGCSIIMNKGPEVALGRLKMHSSHGFDGGYGDINVGTKTASTSGRIEADVPGRAPSSRGAEAIQAAKFQQELEYGKALGDDFFSAHAKLRTAELKGTAPPAELDEMRMLVRQKAAAVAHSMPAKSYLKYGAPPIKGKAYTETMDDVLGDAVAAYNWEMRNRGYNDQTLYHCRNASSVGAGMDADLALKEQPDLIPVRGDDGNMTLKENNWLTQNGQPVSLAKYQKEGSEVLAEAYKKVTGGYSGKQSFVDMTTSLHMESYPDKMWLELPKAGAHSDMDSVTRKLDDFFGKVDSAKLPETLNVTSTKAEIMFAEHPELRKLGSMMETCRGTAKDLDTKFIPLVDSRIRQIEAIAPAKRTPTDLQRLDELTKTRAQLDECLACFNDIGKGRVPPYEWKRRMELTTGGQDAVAVTRRLAKMTEMAAKL